MVTNGYYTHIHFGAIRITLTFHGKKGMIVCARMALLDTKFKEYKDTVLGIVETTLNTGTIFFTVYPNYNMALSNPELLDALKVQVQICGAEMLGSTATLHYEMAYRIQDYAINLAMPHSDETVKILDNKLSKDMGARKNHSTF
ncbi:hypothetical protein DITRI_Ditri05aG0051200 [Diplodiscus trichospermus]